MICLLNKYIHIAKDMDEVSIDEILEAHELIWNCSFSCIKPMSLKCAVELGIPDIINNNDQPITLSKLVSQLPINPSKAHFIGRLMQILVHFGFFSAHKTGQQEVDLQYSLTPVSRLLLKDNPLRASPFLLSQLNPLLIKPCHSLSAWLKDDSGNASTPFEMANGASLWACMGREPGLCHMFAESMAIDSLMVAKIILGGPCRPAFESLESLVDVGGGTGVMAKAIAEAFPETHCTVLDLPYLVCNAQETSLSNFNFVGGDMFKAIPQANAVLLKWALHNWNDEEAVMILKQCREAVDWCKDKGGKVIIIDVVIDDHESQSPNKMDEKSTETKLCFDMWMMFHNTGKERSQKEWETLFYTAGFSHYKISPIVGLRSLIQVYP